MHFIVNNTRGFQNFVFDTIPQNAQRAVKTFEELQPFRLITNNPARTICATVSACIIGILIVSAVVCVAWKIFPTFKGNGKLVGENEVPEQQQNEALESTIATTDAAIKTKDETLASRDSQIRGLTEQTTELEAQPVHEKVGVEREVEKLQDQELSATDLILSSLSDPETSSLEESEVEGACNELASEMRELRKSLETLEEKVEKLEANPKLPKSSAVSSVAYKKEEDE